MRNLLRVKKIMLFAILFSLAYGWMVFSYIYAEWDDMVLGFQQGFQQGFDEANGSGNTEHVFDVHFLTVKPTGNVVAFPDSISEKNSGGLFPSRYYQMRIKTPYNENISSKWKMYSVFQGILTFILFIAIFYIPLQLYRFLNHLQLGVIFDQHNLRWLRKTGISLALVYGFLFMYEYISFLQNKCFFDLEHYTIIMKPVDAIYLVMGVGILLFAEVIRHGVKLKEEQDLTI